MVFSTHFLFGGATPAVYATADQVAANPFESGRPPDGELHQVRQVLFWAMWLFIGVQVIFASFFLSMLGISRGTYIGDYDLK